MPRILMPRSSRLHLVALATSLSLTTGAITVPQAFAAPPQQANAATEVISVSITTVDGENACVFTSSKDADLLGVGTRYHNLLASTISAVRTGLPELKAEFDTADKITGTGPVAIEGSKNSPELTAIAEKVRAAMVERGYYANEIGYALWHVPTGMSSATLPDSDRQDLTWLPSLTQEQAEVVATRPANDPKSLDAMTERFFHAASQLRTSLTKLGTDGSIALLNRVDNQQLLSVLAVAKLVTSSTPAKLTTFARTAVRNCVLKIRNYNFRDGTASSRLIDDPFKGMGSSEDDKGPVGAHDKGDLSSGSSELSAGNGTSTADDLATIFEGGSSKDSRKLGLLMMMVSFIGTIVVGIMRFAPLVAAFNQAIDEAAAKSAKEREAKEKVEAANPV